LNLSTTIRKIISALLLFIFALSITPLVVIHKLAANHIDISYRDNNQKKTQYSKAGVNCYLLDLVAENKFLHYYISFDFTIVKLFPNGYGNYKKSFHTRHHFYAELRGPPAVA